MADERTTCDACGEYTYDCQCEVAKLRAENAALTDRNAALVEACEAAMNKIGVVAKSHEELACKTVARLLQSELLGARDGLLRAQKIVGEYFDAACDAAEPAEKGRPA